MLEANETLPEIDRRVHRELLTGLLATGAIPQVETIVAAVVIAPADLANRLTALQEADYIALNGNGQPVCVYPLSPLPTSHVVVIGGQRRYAMCAIDALGVAAMIGQSVTVEGTCGACQMPIRLAASPGKISPIEPVTTVVVARRSGEEPAYQTCRPFNLFACGPAHGQELATRSPGSAVVPIDEAARHAESIFGDLLHDVLPASRRRAAQQGIGRLRT